MILLLNVCGSHSLFCLCLPVATDFTLKTSDCPDVEFPVKIVDNSRGKLWYKKDTKFKIPKGRCVFVSWDRVDTRVDNRKKQII